MKVLAVIPARYSSSRFMGKVIHPVNGKPLISHLYLEMLKSNEIDRLVVATDDKRIIDALTPYNIEIIKTSKKHKTGSDRAAECLKKIKADIILNIQADNFGLKAVTVDKVIKKFKADKKYDYATIIRRIDNEADIKDFNTVKVVKDNNFESLLFSRNYLPYLQQGLKKEKHKQFKYYKHIGVYLFRAAGLKKYSSWKRSDLERAESLEQLRVLENGYKFKLYETKANTISVDTKRDLRKIDNLYK